MFSNQDLIFVETPALQPPEVALDNNLMQQYEAEMNQAASVPLPNDDDEDI